MPKLPILEQRSSVISVLFLDKMLYM